MSILLSGMDNNEELSEWPGGGAEKVEGKRATHSKLKMKQRIVEHFSWSNDID